MKNFFFLAILGVALNSCDSEQAVNVNISTSSEVNNQGKSQKHTENAVLWHQTSAEYKAICYQTYNLAKMVLENHLQNHAYPYEKAPVIVMDLDETVVDNSFYNAQLVLDKENYSKETWKEWSDLRSAGEIPGAVDFITFAQSKGVKVIFVSNRRVAELENTMENVKALGVQNIDSTNFLLRVDEGSKMGRRNTVSENHEIVMLFGDNLADFTELFDKQSTADRNDLVDSLKLEFGSRYMVLPNVLYGEWEGSLYNYQYNWTPGQKDSIRNLNIKGFK